jgi:arginine/lysine/ornithine decarboxylase
MLNTHAKKKHFSFHTPGHKIGAWDITELSFSDNLISPQSCI